MVSQIGCPISNDTDWLHRCAAQPYRFHRISPKDTNGVRGRNTDDSSQSPAALWQNWKPNWILRNVYMLSKVQ